MSGKYALLLQTEEELEVRVYSDGREKERDLRACKDNPSVNIFWYTTFIDRRFVVEIMKDFSSIYQGDGEVMQQVGVFGFTAVKYLINLDTTILPAFCTYFFGRTE